MDESSTSRLVCATGVIVVVVVAVRAVRMTQPQATQLNRGHTLLLLSLQYVPSARDGTPVLVHP